MDDQAEKILHDLNGQFAHLSKEDLLKRLITNQLDHLMIQSGEEIDLKESYGGSHEKHPRSGFHRYFINIGMIDGLTIADLIHFLSDVSGMDRKLFGSWSIQKDCPFFDVDKTNERE